MAGLFAGVTAQGMAADAAVDTAGAVAAPVPAAPAPRVVRKKAAPVKVSTTQLFTTLGTLESKIDMLQKSILTLPKQAAPTVQMPGPGEGVEAKNMMQAFYNYGSYRKQAENKRLASSLIRDLTVLGGAILAVQGWESSRDRYQPTPSNYLTYRHVPLTGKYLTPYYTSFTMGVSTAAVGLLVAEFISWSAISSEKMADASLMHPLEAQPQTAAP